jgi:Cu/Ag efflux protein CusF
MLTAPEMVMEAGGPAAPAAPAAARAAAASSVFAERMGDTPPTAVARLATDSVPEGEPRGHQGSRVRGSIQGTLFRHPAPGPWYLALPRAAGIRRPRRHEPEEEDMTSKIAVALVLSLAATGTMAEPPREFSASQAESVTAKVKKVDQKTREVTQEGPDGDVTFKAGDEVKNLAQLKKGDEVSATLYQSLTLRILGKDEVAPELAAGTGVVRALPGQKPGGAATAEVRGVATVEAIAADKTSVTLKGPRGNSVELAVKNPQNLEGVAVGTRVAFAYTETLAVSVAAPEKKK